jgi:hypothetical protein
VTRKRKEERKHVRAIFSLIGAVAFSCLLGGCADVQYANNGFRSPEAKYNTFYAPDYYPYYPWDGYYGGAYYYGNEADDSKTVVAVSDHQIQ